MKMSMHTADTVALHPGVVLVCKCAERPSLILLAGWLARPGKIHSSECPYGDAGRNKT